MPNSAALPRLLSLLLASTVAVACSKGASNADSARVTDSAGGMVATTPSADDVDDRVEQALDANTELANFGLDADDHDNRVVLKGAVKTAEQKALAEQLATAQAAGVPIDNRIRVEPTLNAMTPKPADLDDLEDQVEEAIEADSTLKSLDVDVDEGQGGLILEGTVSTADQKAAVEALAKRVAPTATIMNRITVK